MIPLPSGTVQGTMAPGQNACIWFGESVEVRQATSRHSSNSQQSMQFSWNPRRILPFKSSSLPARSRRRSTAELFNATAQASLGTFYDCPEALRFG